MKNVGNFINHAKSIVLDGVVSFNESYAIGHYSRYSANVNKNEITRDLFLQSWTFLAEIEKCPHMVIEVDDLELELYVNNCTLDFVDVYTGEVVLTLGEDCEIEYSNDWAKGLYNWNR